STWPTAVIASRATPPLPRFFHASATAVRAAVQRSYARGAGLELGRRTCAAPVGRSDPQSRRRGEHGRAARVDGVDDLGVVDALEVHRGNAEVGVAELAL